MSYDEMSAGHGQVNLDAVLAEYRKKRTIELMLPPVISFLVHVCVLVPAALLVTGKTEVVKDDLVSEVIIQEEVVIEEEPEFEEPVEEIVMPMDPTDVAEVEVTTPDIEVPDPTPNNDIDLEMPSDVKVNTSILKTNSLFGMRSAGGRKAALNEYAGRYAKYTEQAVLRALNWLKANQHKDGYWPAEGGQHTPAMTSLALLCFMAHGEKQTSEIYGDTILRAIRWLVDQVDLEKGHYKGALKTSDGAYTNSMMAYSISECYGVTKLPQLKKAMDSMISFILKSQHEKGGWRYYYKANQHSDTSLSGWHVQALKAAQASGCTVPGIEEAFKKATVMYKASVLPDGRAYYKWVEKQSPKYSLTGVAGLCLQFMGHARSDQVRTIVENLEKNFKIKDPKQTLFDWNGPLVQKKNWHTNVMVYDWYYMTQVVFQAADINPKLWGMWNAQFLYGELVRNQKTGRSEDGIPVGWWDWPGWEVSGVPKHKPTEHWQRVYSTALSSLSLMVYYRNLPVFKVKEKPKKAPTAEKADDGGDDLLDLDLL